MSLNTINYINIANGRMYKMPYFEINDKPQQGDSHGLSYFETREMYKSFGDEMGFESKTFGEILEGLDKILEKQRR